MVVTLSGRRIHWGVTHRARAVLRLAAVVAAHAAALLALAQLDPDVRATLAPVFVSLITPPRPLGAVVVPPPSAPPSASRPEARVAPKPAPAPANPVVATESVAMPIDANLAPSVSALPKPLAAAPAIAEPPAPAPSAAAAATPAVAKPTAPMLPPRFDAAYLNNPRPDYPRLARRMGEHGKVMLHVYVAATGVPEKVEIRSSSGSPRLDQAARDAVAQWKFIPARQGEEPVPAWVLVPITFVLEG